jgi:hypothetical protein
LNEKEFESVGTVHYHVLIFIIMKTYPDLKCYDERDENIEIVEVRND